MPRAPHADVSPDAAPAPPSAAARVALSVLAGVSVFVHVVVIGAVETARAVASLVKDSSPPRVVPPPCGPRGGDSTHGPHVSDVAARARIAAWDRQHARAKAN